MLESSGAFGEISMIPLRDENRSYSTPYIVYILIAVNIIVYLIDWLGSQNIAPGIRIGGLFKYSMVPAQVISGDPEIPIKYGPYLLRHVSAEPTWITIFTSMFLHGGLLHLGGNMLYLWIFGDNVENVLGHIGFLLFYLFGGFCAAAAHILFNINSTVPTVGASGAIAAVLGAYFWLYPRNRVDCLVFLGYFVTIAEIPAVFVLGLWFVLQLVNATLTTGAMQGGGIAFWAHIGGFVAGVIMIIMLGGRRIVAKRRRFYGDFWYD